MDVRPSLGLLLDGSGAMTRGSRPREGSARRRNGCVYAAGGSRTRSNW